MRLLFAFALAGAFAGAGCGKKSTEGGVRLEQVNDALKGAGFQLDNFTRIDGARYSAHACATGPVGGIDALVCEYPSEGAAGLGKKAAEGWVAESVTGAVLINGRTLLAVADRGHADPNGKTIHKITQAYTKIR